MNKGHPIKTTAADIDAALLRARSFAPFDPRIRSAHYDPEEDAVVLVFPDAVRLSLPRRKMQGLTDASTKQLKRIDVVGQGTGLHWPLLDVDHYVLGLVQHVFGTKSWMAEIGRKGGFSRSAPKRKASRANGRKGGRPKKHSQVA